MKVQVKSGGANVGTPDVQALYGTVAASEFGQVVTLNNFTTQATNRAKGKSNLRLINGSELVDIILRHYEAFDSRYKGLLQLRQLYIPEPIWRGTADTRGVSV